MAKRQRLPWKDELRDIILNRDGCQCFYCGATGDLSLDHIISFKMGGDDTAGNLVTSCRSCNSSKGKRMLLPKFREIVLSSIRERNALYGIDSNLRISIDEPDSGMTDYMYFPNGRKRYEYRDRQDKLDSCGAVIGTDKVTGKSIREFRCKLPECPKCMEIRRKERSDSFEARIKNVSDEELFYLTIDSGIEEKRLQEWAFYNKSQYISVPAGGNKRDIIINRRRRGAVPVSHDKAIEILQANASLMYLDRSKRVSGKLGLV